VYLKNIPSGLAAGQAGWISAGPARPNIPKPNQLLRTARVAVPKTAALVRVAVSAGGLNTIKRTSL
jgi:hypothetical protein